MSPSPHALLALLRIGASLILLYVLFVRSFDLESNLTVMALGGREAVAPVDPLGGPFSIFTWSGGTGWLWTAHVLAMLTALLLLLGVLTPVMSLLSLVFQLAYVHHNPMMMVGIDALLMTVLFYLSFSASGQMLSVAPNRIFPRKRKFSPVEGQVWSPEQTPFPWSGFPIRLLQLHICLIYLHSALGKMSTDWLMGAAFWHPHLVETGVPFTLETLLGTPWLTSMITYGLVLFELFFVVLVWQPRLRYPLLVLMAVVHITVGIAWDMMAFNLAMIMLNIAFIAPMHAHLFVEMVRPLLALPWLTENS